MRKVRQQLGLSATIASLTFVCVMALVIASCSSQSGNPTSPTGLGAPDSQAAHNPGHNPGGDSCPAGFIEGGGAGGGTFTAPAGQVVLEVCIKAGNTATGLVLTASNGCYTVTGIGTQTVTVGGGGTSNTCQAISHFKVLLGPGATPTPTPTGTP